MLKNILQRITAVAFYIGFILLLGYFFRGNLAFILDPDDPLCFIFFTVALTLILGVYLSEPFFTKPSDVLVRSISTTLVLLAVKDKTDFILWKQFLIVISVLGIAALVITLINSRKSFATSPSRKFSKFITTVGSSEIIFGTLYVLVLVSFFRDAPVMFLVCLIILLVLLVWRKPVESFILICSDIYKVFERENALAGFIGEAIGCENPFLYNVEIDLDKYKSNANKGDIVYLEQNQNSGYVGIVVNTRHLIGKRWLSVYLLKDDSTGNIILLDLVKKELTETANNTIASSKNVYKINLDLLPDKEIIENNALYKNKRNFIGYIVNGSTISTINFQTIAGLTDTNLSEGLVIQTTIYNNDVLFQIINARTDKEKLEDHSQYGYTVGVAQKLGRYDIEHEELNSVKWLPDIYTPVFIYKPSNINAADANQCVGVLPGTNLEIPVKNYDELITHNTAILGILGIGKSCLTFELIKKIIDNTQSKIICIDITNEYIKKLPQYINNSLIVADSEHFSDSIADKFNYIYTENGSKQNHEKSGNIAEYKQLVKQDLIKFIFGQETIPDNKELTTDIRLKVYNPNLHNTSKGEKIGYNVITTELTHAEKTRVICETLLDIVMRMPLSANGKSKILLVFEEAHALIPEWNSTANSNDSSAVNGTAKVILQGRKYGVGSFVITQRTANISKSILNQCNTIFALRVFDDTGKQFLENYVGKDYASLLPTLEERHAVVIGKALKLKQPVVITLNDKDKIASRVQEAGK
ncbi:MAG: DUF87 domain-containing protein [Candidatus Margulisbacteria bacterium]|nr:DUF87 domain-containing protein [Candidatus Margulisiibacteriota bacterium]